MNEPIFPPVTKLANRRFPRRDLYALIKDDRVVWDQTLPGFGLRFHPSGRRTWLVFTRIKGVVSKIHLGNAAVVTEAEARGKAQLLILEAKVRLDPLARKKQARATPQFHEFCATYWKRQSVKCVNRRAKLTPDRRPTLTPFGGVRGVARSSIGGTRGRHRA
jgi:hypothetical protein